MNGCQFQSPRFSAPAGPGNLTDIEWDIATLTKKEFIAKYGRNRYDAIHASWKSESD
jgi:hypothetical protein